MPLILFLLLTGVLAAQTTPPADTTARATSYMEWLLDARFDATQRAHYAEIIAQMWRQNGREPIEAMARASASTAQASAADRSARQQQFVHMLEQAADEPSRWLLDIYRSAHASAPAPAGLLGRWSDGHLSSIQYKNAYTGVSAPTNGNMFTYEFRADGTYSFTGLMQSVLYNCTTAVFSNETGTYSAGNGAVSLQPEKNPYRMTNNCVPSSNRESPGKLVARTYRYRTVQENGRRYLELRGEDGVTQKFAQSPLR